MVDVKRIDVERAKLRQETESINQGLLNLCETFASEVLNDWPGVSVREVTEKDGDPYDGYRHYLIGYEIRQTGPERILFGLIPKRKTLIYLDAPGENAQRLTSSCYDSAILDSWEKRLVEFCSKHNLEGVNLQLVERK